MPRIIWCAIVVATAVFGGAGSGEANVLLAKNEALALAFPDAERIEERVVFLTEKQKAEIEQRSGAKLESQLWTVWVGWRGDAVLGYAVIDNHVVRTLPEAFMVILEPDGTVRRVEILAFYEPLEYKPSERWMAQFVGRDLGDDLTFRRDIQGITGATLSAVAMTAGVRRVLALFEVAVGPGDGSGAKAEPPPAAKAPPPAPETAPTTGTP